MPARKADAHRIYQLKITLQRIRPPIWRRIQVPSDITLPRLHDVLQIVMGWSDYHLHVFKIGGTEYGMPDPEYCADIANERRVKLGHVVRWEQVQFLYEYDFGDSWEHQILVEKILYSQPNRHSPVCLTGRRACPPEDCGGVWGYAELLEALADPDHPEHDSMREWAGGDVDPAAFDLEAVNVALSRIR